MSDKKFSAMVYCFVAVREMDGWLDGWLIVLLTKLFPLSFDNMICLPVFSVSTFTLYNDLVSFEFNDDFLK